jgi:hypothetical protein
MHQVLTVKLRADDRLVVGKRWAERFAGVVLAVLACTILVSAWPAVFASPTLRPLLVFPFALTLLGLRVALSSRHFTFTRDSQACRCRTCVLGIIRLERTIDFVAVTSRRQFDWYTPRWLYSDAWLYSVALVERERSRGRPIAMGYAPGRIRVEELIATIAEFTGCETSECA